MKLKLFLLAFVFLVGSAEQISAQKFLDKVLKGLEKTNQVLDEADKVLGGDNDSSNTGSGKQRSRRTGGFQIVSPHPDLDIQFKRCAASASTVIIDLVITNYGEDQRLCVGSNGVYSSINIFDDLGNQYNNQNTTISIANGEFQNEPRSLFPSEVPLKVRVQITNVKRDANVFKKILIPISGMNDPLTIQNCPIERNDVVTQITPSESEGVVASTDKSDEDASNAVLTTASEDTKELPKLKKIIGKWELASLKKNGKEITFKPCTLQFYDNDDPYSKDMTETISGKARETGYTIMPDYDNELIMSLNITDDEVDNSYKIQTVDTNKLVLTFGFYGESSIKGELVFNRI